MTHPAVRVVLADDHALVRSGLKALIEQTPGHEVVGEAGDGESLLEVVRQTEPDLLIVDIQMPRLGGLDALDRLRQAGCTAKVLILSMYSAEDYVLRAVRAGANGYLLKDAAASELGAALTALRQGNRYLSPKVSETLAQVGHRLDQPLPSLSPRQREVLQLIARGRATKEIAFELGLSPKTVESHRAQIMDRLGIRDVAGLVRYALRHGMIREDD
ncbi:MAG: DNA-binding response regulator [Lysobacteraceae bacterium]|nr:MAG: DNA-binding response regulator [Xanthomonadaceae bacterium]